MDLNNIVLSPAELAGLYHSTLVDTTNQPSVDSKKIAEVTPRHDKQQWPSLGENRKNILIVVDHKDISFLPDDELNFLTEILGACKLSMADVAVVNLRTDPEATYKELTAAFKSKIVLLFAVEPAVFGLPMSFPHYQLQPFAGNSFIFSPSLSELREDKVQKSKLWVCLKRLFNL